jgi:hypothetical protein
MGVINEIDQYFKTNIEEGYYKYDEYIGLHGKYHNEYDSFQIRRYDNSYSHSVKIMFFEISTHFGIISDNNFKLMNLIV